MSAEKKNIYRMVLVSTVANIPAFVFGMSIGWMSPMTPLLQSADTPSSAPISDSVVSWMAGCLSIGATASAPVFSIVADRLGRKLALMLISFLFAVSWAIMLVSAEADLLIVARAVAGFATGGVYIVIPIYVREISKDSIRGALGSIMMFACNFGIITIYMLGAILSYHLTLWLCVMVPLFHIIVACFVPESPAYSIKGKHFEEAAETVAWLRNLDVTDLEVQNEVIQLQKEEEEATITPKLTLRNIVKNRGLFRAVRVALIVVLTETLSGCFAIIQYSALIFYRAGTEWRPEYLSLFVGATQLLGSILSIYLVERCGRKPLLLTSTLVIFTSMFTIAGWFVATDYGLSVSGWLPVFAVCLSIFSYGAGLGSVPFVIMAEIFSFQVRASLSGSVVCGMWLVSAGSVSLFMPVANAFGDHAVFFMYALITLSGALYIAFHLPETKNKPLSQIQMEMDGNVIRYDNKENA